MITAFTTAATTRVDDVSSSQWLDRSLPLRSGECLRPDLADIGNPVRWPSGLCSTEQSRPGGTGVPVSVHMSDLDRVTELVQLNAERADSDTAKLRQALHSTATMTGHSDRCTTPLPPHRPVLRHCRGQYPHDGADYRDAIRSIGAAGDAGGAVLVESVYLGCDSVGEFAVAHIDGRWQMTNKPVRQLRWWTVEPPQLT